MSMKLPLFAAVSLAALALAGCNDRSERQVQGWVEAELVFVSPDEQGRIVTEKVREGDHVKQGELLFTLDDDLQTADVEVKRAALTNATQSFDRAEQLLTSATGTRKDYEDAQAGLRQARANLDAAETRLTRRKVFSPAEGTIQEVYFRVGETVPPAKPVMALLPPGNLKLRFFVPEALLPEVKYGQSVPVSCDGCAQGLTATVSFIADSAEYTPPVIYSRKERAKLVYLIEARPAEPGKFRVGQPVTVTLPEQPK
jgi:HlyD family secretion protein